MNRQTKIELAFAFSQMFEKDLARVPKELQKEVLRDLDTEELKGFDPEKPFTSQNLSEETLLILAAIFGDEE